MRNSILTKSIHTQNSHLNTANMAMNACIERRLTINMTANNNNNGFKQCRIMNIIYVVAFLCHKKKIVILIFLLVY